MSVVRWPKFDPPPEHPAYGSPCFRCEDCDGFYFETPDKEIEGCPYCPDDHKAERARRERKRAERA